jgi:hypothetical protein
MPTVKLHSSGKVILKDGKVSCACCESPEPDCCMYPADMLGAEGGYTAADLPDAVTAFGFDLQKRTSGFPSYEFADVIVGYLKDGTPADGDYAIVRDSETLDNWQVWSFNGDEWDMGAGFGGIGNCLITGDGNLTPGDDTVEDQFADCYEVEIVGGDGAGTYTLIRRSLCVWDNDENNAEEDPRPMQLYYDTVTDKWLIDVDDIYVHDGPQSSPSGDYGSGQATVTEC